MSTIRTAVFVGCLILLGGGYVASQWNALQGLASPYAAAVDSTPVKALSTVLLAASILLYLWPASEPEGDNT